MGIGDIVTFKGIATPVELLICDVIDVQLVEILYFDKRNIIRKETVLKNLLKLWNQKEITSGENA